MHAKHLDRVEARIHAKRSADPAFSRRVSSRSKNQGRRRAHAKFARAEASKIALKELYLSEEGITAL